MAGGGNDARGQGRICVDCDFVQFTTSCRQHFAHVGRALIKLRLDAEKPPKASYAEKKRRMTEHVKSHMNEMCCAEMPDGTEECDAKYCIIHVRRTMAKRATHVARKMTEEKHPKAMEHFDVATQATGPRAPAPAHMRDHPLTPCPFAHNRWASTRSTRTCTPTRSAASTTTRPTWPRWSAWASRSCTTRPRRTGYDTETLQAKLDELGINVGEGLMAHGQDVGVRARGRGPVKSAFFEKQAKDEAERSTLMRESRERIGGQARPRARRARRRRAPRTLATAGTGWGSTRCTRAACAGSCTTRAA